MAALSTRLDGGQVRLVLGLRWRLLVRNARTKPFAFGVRVLVALAGLGVLAAVSLAIGAGVSLLQSRGERQHAETVLHLVYAMGFLWLALGPLLAFRANEFLDVTKLFHLPVSHRTVFVASLLGAFVSPGTLMALGPVAAASVGFGGGFAAVCARLATGAVVVGVGVAAGQTVLLLLLNTLRSRIWRDVLLVVGPLLGGVVFVGSQLALRASDDGGPAVVLATLHDYLSWMAPLPSWWGAQAAVSTDWVGRLPALGLPVLAWILVGAAARLQEKAYYGELWAPPPQSVRARRERRWFRFLPDPIGALEEKDLKLLFREPVVRMMVVQQGIWALFPVVLTLWKVLTSEGPDAEGISLAPLPFLPLVALVLLLMELALLMNLLGLEGGGIVHTLLTPVRAGQVLYAKVFAYLAVFGGVNAAVAFALAVTGYSWAGAPGEGVARGLLDGALAFVATATALAICAPASVLLPIRLAARGRRALRQQTTGREGCLMVLKNTLAMGLVGFAILPAVALVHHADILTLLRPDLAGGLWSYLSVPLGLVCAAAIAVVAVRAGVQMAAASAEKNVERLVDRLARPEE